MASKMNRIFREYGNEFFGEKAMNHITDEQVEEARCAAFKELNLLTEKYGKQKNGTCKELFCNYIFGYFM